MTAVRMCPVYNSGALVVKERMGNRVWEIRVSATTIISNPIPLPTVPLGTSASIFNVYLLHKCVYANFTKIMIVVYHSTIFYWIWFWDLFIPRHTYICIYRYKCIIVYNYIDRYIIHRYIDILCLYYISYILDIYIIYRYVISVWYILYLYNCIWNVIYYILYTSYNIYYIYMIHYIIL